MKLCRTCNKELPKNRKLYCSNNCKRHERKELLCKVCGKSIPIKRKRRTTFCSEECHQKSCRGPGNPMYGKASAMKGKPGAMLGKKHKISTIDKMSLTRKKQWSDAEFRKVMIDKLAKGRGNSRPELKVKEILDNLGITYKREKLEKKYLYDFYIPIKNIYIEVNGDFWHANPNKYMADSELSFPGYGKIKAKHLWDKDKKKREYVEGLGAKYVCIWESELKDKDANILLTERLNHAGFSI